MRKSEALRYRQRIESAVQSLPDSEALEVATLYPKWEDLIGKTVDKAEYKFQHNGKLYKTISANHTFQADWVPGVGTESIYTRIDEEHDGSLADPIPASRGMEYEYGKYYLDNEDGKTYRCERIGEAAGGKIVLQYLPHELIGNYFKAV